MNGTYDDVLALLGPTWGTTRPPKDQVNKALRAGQTPEQIARALNAYVNRAANPPKGYEGDPWEYKLYKVFGGSGHFPKDAANIALGFSAEPDALPSVPGARTADDAWEIALLGWYYFGDTKFLDLTTEYGKNEFARRWEFGLHMPVALEGRFNPRLYLYFAIVGLIATGPRPFGVGVDELADTRKWAGFDLQKYLDNEWAVRDMLPAPWGQGGVPQ